MGSETAGVFSVTTWGSYAGGGGDGDACVAVVVVVVVSGERFASSSTLLQLLPASRFFVKRLPNAFIRWKPRLLALVVFGGCASNRFDSDWVERSCVSFSLPSLSETDDPLVSLVEAGREVEDVEVCGLLM